jgi:hypothetical protein
MSMKITDTAGGGSTSVEFKNKTGGGAGATYKRKAVVKWLEKLGCKQGGHLHR